MIIVFANLTFRQLIQIISMPSSDNHEEAWTELKAKCCKEEPGLIRIVTYYEQTLSNDEKLSLYYYMIKDEDFSTFEICKPPEILKNTPESEEIIPYEGRMGICG